MRHFKRKKKSSLAVFLLLIIIGIGAYFLFHAKGVKAEWFDANWFYRQAVTVTVTSSSSDVSDLDTWFTMNTSSLISTNKLQSNCQDLRFTNANGKLLPYFIDSGCNTTATKIWVRIDLVPKNSTTYTLYAYYGNPSAGSGSDSTKFNLYNGLVGYWNMNESTGAGTGLSDFSVNNSTATASLWGGGNTSTDSAHVAGKYGNAFSFDGGDDYLNAGNRASLNPTNAITVGAWINAQAPTASGWGTIVANPYDTGCVNSYWLGYNKYNSTAGGVNWYIRGVKNYQNSSALWNFGQWTHIVGTYDKDGGSNNFNVYINGQRIYSSTETGSISTSVYNLYMGNENCTGGNYFHKGLMDDTRIYNRALSQAEILQLYNSTSSILTAVSGQAKPTVSFATEEKGPAPVAYFKFDEGQGTTAYDQSSNHNNGTLSGTTNPTWVTEDQCIAGKCLSFPGGSSGSVTVANTITGVQTVSFWVNPSTSSAALIDLNAADVSITASSGTLSAPNFTSPTIYVNGVVSSTFTANTWQFVTITTGTGVSASAIKIGNVKGNYFKGFIDDFKIYPYARTADQVKADYNAGKSAVGGSANSVSMGTKNQDWLANGLVMYWKMDEATCGPIDSSGNGNNASCTNSPVATPSGKFGNALAFDGSSNQSVSITDNASISVANVTESLWINITGTTGTYQVPGWKGSEIEISMDLNLNPRFGITSTGGRTVTTTSGYAMSQNTWHNIVMTYDGTTIRGYLDGELIHTKTHANPGRITDGSSTFIVSDPTYDVKGYVDEVRLYNRAMSAKEVKDLYNWAPGPVGYWKMDDKISGASQAIIDSSGYGNNGTTYSANGTGMNCKIIGRYGGGCLFDGVDDYVNVGNPAILNFGTGSFTVEAWVKKDTGTSAQYGGVFKGCGDVNIQSGWVLRINNVDGGISFYGGDGSNNVFGVGAWTGQNNVWMHIVGVLDRSAGKAFLYQNGALIGTDSSILATSISSSDSLTFAKDWSSSHNLKGSLDDIKIFNYVRTQKQILEDMNVGHPSVGSPVGSYAGYWKFDEGTGTSAKDQSVNANTGTITGATWTNDGKFGKALSFDGTSSYVDAGNGSSLNTSTNSFSASLWFKATADQSNKTLLSKSIDGTHRWLIYFKTVGSGMGDISINLSGAGGSITKYSGVVPVIGQWYHVVLVRDYGNTAVVYINGVAYSMSDTSGDLGNNTANVTIGTYNKTAGINYFSGVIDEVKIYPFALTADDIKTEYNQGKSIVMGSISNTSLLSGGSVASNSASAAYCIPGDTATCNSPVGEWAMDEKSGTSANDTSGNNNNGSLGGGTAGNMPTWQRASMCHSGSCLKFDGVDDYVNLGTGDNLDMGTNDRTYELWFKNNGSYTAPSTLISSGAGSGSLGVDGIWAFVDSSSSITVNFTDGTAARVVKSLNTGPLFDGKWHHLVLVFDRNVGVYLYLDGVVSSSGTLDITSQQTDVNDLYPQRIGAYAGSANFYFNGLMDDVRVFNYARTPAQIAWDYNRGKPVGYWIFDECQGSIANDISGNGNNGTITIGTTAPQTVLGTCQTPTDGTGAWYNGKSGKFNSALSFDGVDDYVSVPSSTSLNPTNAITISYWINPTTISGNELFRKSQQYSDYLSGTTDTFYPNVDGSDRGGPAVSLSTGQWQLVTWIYDASTHIASGYKNGQFVSSVTLSGLNSYTLGAGNNSALGIGYRNTGSDRYFRGLADDFKIYNYALTPAQIQLEYNQGAAVRFGPTSGRP